MSKHAELLETLEQEHSFDTSSPSEHLRGAAFGGSQQVKSSLRANEEALRLAQQLFLSRSLDAPRVVTFAGIDHGNGCSHIAASVAVTLAKASRKPVCLVEANFRSPALPAMFETTNHFGLTDSLLHKGPIVSFLKPVAGENLWLLSAGMLAPDSASLLASERLQERIHELRQAYDFVIIDSPPLARYSDALVLGQLSDGLVLVLEASFTRREAAAVVANNLRSSKVNILAAVLNKRTYPIPRPLYNLL